MKQFYIDNWLDYRDQTVDDTYYVNKREGGAEPSVGFLKLRDAEAEAKRLKDHNPYFNFHTFAVRNGVRDTVATNINGSYFRTDVTTQERKEMKPVLSVFTNNGQGMEYGQHDTVPDAKDHLARKVGAQKGGEGTVFQAVASCKLPVPDVKWEDAPKTQ